LNRACPRLRAGAHLAVPRCSLVCDVDNAKEMAQRTHEHGIGQGRQKYLAAALGNERCMRCGL
jgi:hypothetical protein